MIAVGRPVPTQEVRIVDELDRVRGEREIGEIVVRGPSVMKGYWNAPRETAEVLRGGWLHTGDLGYLAEGRLFISGRAKDLIIRNGRNYHPQDVEYQVAQLDGVRKGSVIAFGVGEGDAKVVLVAEVRSGRSGRSGDDGKGTEELLGRIRERFHETFLFHADEIVLVQPGMIPRTTSGKVRRRECKKRYLEGTLSKSGGTKYGSLVKAVAGSLWLKYTRR